MKTNFIKKSFIGLITFMLAFSFTMFSANTSAHASSSSATVTHYEVTTSNQIVQELEVERFSYPIGAEFTSYMKKFPGYRMAGVSSSVINIGGVERVVASVNWLRVETKNELIEESIPYETIEKEDPSLDKGERIIEQTGVNGKKEVLYKITYVGGRVESKRSVSEEIIKEATDEIVRVGTKVTEVKQDYVKERVPYKTIEKEDPSLEEGVKEIGQAGVHGEKTYTYDVTYVNGDEVDRKLVSEEITKEPVDEIILIGTKVVEINKEEVEENIPFEVTEVEDPNLPKGETKTEQEGKFGKKIVTYEVTLENGKEVDRQVISEEIILKSVDEIIKVGTKEIPLEAGNRHKDVIQLKKDLAKAGFTVPGNNTTLFGKQTEAKVMDFQKYYGLSVTGKADNATKEKLKEVVNSPLQNGKRHKDTIQLKKDLAKAGFAVPGNNTNLYGTQTVAKVKAFQKKYKLVQNGIADEVTLAKLKSVANAPLSTGMRHPEVIQLKKDLAKAGFKVPGNNTNYYGKQTATKVKDFQKYYGLGVTGKADNATKAKLKAVVNSPLQNGKRHKDTIQLKKDLAKAGFTVPGNNTNLYGTQTVAKVKAFQKKHKLIQNGIADEVTLAKLKSVANAPLSTGMRHPEVIQLKKDLAKAGFKVPGNNTNYYGKQTATKVKAFQKYYGLNVTGKADNATKAKLKAVVNSPLQNGKRHKNTIQLKKDLAKAGFTVPGNTTNLYGTQTVAKVKAFQKKYKLVQNGIADEVTLAKLKSVANAPLSTGMRHPEVIQLKKDLTKAGFKVPGNTTNYYGQQTATKVKDFQKYYGLSVTGKADNATKAKLKAVVNSPLQNGKRHKDTIQLKKDLAKVGFTVPGNTTNFYGKQTAVKVKAFQKKHKLVQNGIADEITLAKLKSTLTSK